MAQKLITKPELFSVAYIQSKSDLNKPTIGVTFFNSDTPNKPDGGAAGIVMTYLWDLSGSSHNPNIAENYLQIAIDCLYGGLFCRNGEKYSSGDYSWGRWYDKNRIN